MMEDIIARANEVAILFAGKELGAPTGNSLYDNLKNITGLLSLGIIVIALMNPKLRQNVKLKKHYKKIIKLRDDLMEAIKIFEAELAARKGGIPGESTEEQLEKVLIPELKRVLTKVNNNEIPEKEQRYFQSLKDAQTLWGWDMENPTEIGKLLIKLDDQYSQVLD